MTSFGYLRFKNFRGSYTESHPSLTPPSLKGVVGQGVSNKGHHHPRRLQMGQGHRILQEVLVVNYPLLLVEMVIIMVMETETDK